ncbi:MAG: ABC transporter permease, partial [Polyangiaceae bacterium]
AATYDAAVSTVAFFGELLGGMARAVRHPQSVRWVDLPRLTQLVGADGLAIVCLMSGLLGLVTGYQGAMQLQRFGAVSYTANLVGLAMVRELAPLMTAIVVTGRSGAAFAAELATMKVSEEVDALRTMGFSPQGFLVLPRCLALLLALPVLTLVADVASIFGALLVASLVVDASPIAFLIQTQKAVGASDVVAGILKSVFYAQAIGFIACHQGLSASGGAEGVGLRTTKTVVGTLVVLVVIDALLTILFHELSL